MNKLRKILKMVKNPAYAGEVMQRKIDYAVNEIKRPWDILYLEINGMCNLSCIICARHTTSEELGYMPFDTYLRIDEQLFSKIKNLSIRGLGEPLMHKDVIKMVALAKSRGVLVRITTNAMLLDENMARGLVSSGLDSLAVSLDGATKETYEKIRVGSKFEQVIDNLRMLNRVKESLGRANPEVFLVPVLMKTNIAELPAFVELAHSLGHKCMGLSNVFCWTEEQDKTLPLYYENESEFIGHINKAKALAQRLGVTLYMPGFLPRKSGTCTFNPKKSFIITWKGEVRPCCHLFHSYTYVYAGVKKRLPPLIFGNIKGEKFKHIWNSAEYRKFRQRITNKDFPEVCQDCLVLKGL